MAHRQHRRYRAEGLFGQIEEEEGGDGASGIQPEAPPVLTATDRCRRIRPHGCNGSDHDCVPRPEHSIPTPGMIGVLSEPSLGVHEKALPSLSITHR